eukprot:TRINITY_DN1996_c1_g1_i1.p1 TRINITY_DN1996_c1_g1~~TRINITY_DN1996_c1_g1_i1.p1  ORF type:complete len:81 (+),score=1.65 TRINITY_DN1996_c1_g1_i1:78-320(+)
MGYPDQDLESKTRLHHLRRKPCQLHDALHETSSNIPFLFKLPIVCCWLLIKLFDTFFKLFRARLEIFVPHWLCVPKRNGC